MTQTVDKTTVVDRAKQTVATRTVFIKADKTGVLPMERRLPDGSKNISSCIYNAAGKMQNVVNVRPLNFGTNGVEVINPAEHDDMAHLAEVKAWLAEGSDSRIAKYNVRIQEGGSAEGTPFPLYDKLKPDALIKRMTEDADVLADDPVAVREFLEKCARYELQGKKRPKVLGAIEALGDSSGVEYGTDEVDEL